MEREIKLQVPYGLLLRRDRAIDEFGLNPYAVREWLVDYDDLKTITITPKTAWLLDYVRDAIIV